MKKVTVIILVLLTSMLLASCASQGAFKSEADEKLYRSIEQGGDIGEVKESVANGASIDRLRRGRLISVNMVEFAALSGHTDIAEWLINNGADVNFKTSIMGETLLMSMAAAGEYRLCELLLEKGADIGAKDRLSDTALEYVFKAGGNVSESDIDRLVTLLLDKGARIRRETLAAALNGYTGNGDGDCRYGLIRRIALALKESGTGAGLRPALEAAITGDGKTALERINEGGVSEQDQRQILCYTAAFGSASALRELEDKGIDIKTADKDGNTLLMIAARYGNTDAVRHIMDKSPDYYAKNRFGKTALEVAGDAENTTIADMIEARQPARETWVFGSEYCCDSCACACCCSQG